MQKDEIAVNAMMRGECYRFLAACFYQPQKELLEGADFLPTLIADLEEVCPAAAPHAQAMRAALPEYTEEELAVEHARLFVGPFGLKAPPYGSVYLDGERTVMGPSTMEVIRLYEEEGLARDKDFQELPDHIAVELEFLYYLNYRQAEALQKGDISRAARFRAKEVEFKNGFPDRWVPAFCSAIKEDTANRFYTALADCLCTTLGTDLETTF